MTVEIKNDRLYSHANYPSQGKDRIWDVVKDGKFIIGADSEEKARQGLADLKASNWQYLALYSRGAKDPISWIAHVREKEWTFEQAEIHLGFDDRVMFHGNISEYSAVFWFLILDWDYARKVIEQAPEVAVTGSDPRALAKFEAEVLVRAAGHTIHNNGLDVGWYALLPGESHLRQMDDDYNYFGFFASKENLVAEVAEEIVVPRAIDFYGLSQNAWKALSLSRKITCVKEAMAAESACA